MDKKIQKKAKAIGELEDSELEAVAGGADFEIAEDVTATVTQAVEGVENAAEGRPPLADVTQQFTTSLANEDQGVAEAEGNPDMEGEGPQAGEPGSEENAENIPPGT